MQKITVTQLYRVLDANYNRAKEGLRVCEDVCRFVFNEGANTRRYKDLRHQLTAEVIVLGLDKLVVARDIDGDVGKKTSRPESRRKHVAEIFYANAQRAKESVRVLEEFAKLLNPRLAEKLKRLRYALYALEKDIIEKF